MDGRIAFDREQGRHRHRSGIGDARQIVAHQIDDHQVFGALFGVGGKRLRRFKVRCRIGQAPRGALHRPADELTSCQCEEQFGRQ